MFIQQSIKRFRQQPPVSVVKIVVLRTTTIMFLLLNTLLMTMAVMLRPWKSENLEGDQKWLEIGVFHVCRAVFSKGIKCYQGEPEKDPRAWFMTFRWFLLISTFFGYLSVFIALIQLMRNTKQVLSVFLAPA